MLSPDLDDLIKAYKKQEIDLSPLYESLSEVKLAFSNIWIFHSEELGELDKKD